MSKTSILDQNEEMDNNQPVEDLVAAFFANLGKNMGKVFEVKAIPISDKEKKVKIATLKAYFLNEIKVNSFDLTKKKGYVEINHGELDMPLVNLKLQDGPYYFYDKENAISKVKSLNQVERELIDEKTEQYLLAQEYMRRVDEGMYF
jgi:hypothetical protein